MTLLKIIVICWFFCQNHTISGYEKKRFCFFWQKLHYYGAILKWRHQKRANFFFIKGAFFAKRTFLVKGSILQKNVNFLMTSSFGPPQSHLYIIICTPFPQEDDVISGWPLWWSTKLHSFFFKTTKLWMPKISLVSKFV